MTSWKIDILFGRQISILADRCPFGRKDIYLPKRISIFQYVIDGPHCMGDICKYKQHFLTLHNSFFHKLYLCDQAHRSLVCPCLNSFGVGIHRQESLSHRLCFLTLLRLPQIWSLPRAIGQRPAAGTFVRYRSKFCVQAGHETKCRSIGNKHVSVRPTKIMNRADKYWAHFQKINYFKIQSFQKIALIKVGLLVNTSFIFITEKKIVKILRIFYIGKLV